jgi:hypothetical protein
MRPAVATLKLQVQPECLLQLCHNARRQPTEYRPDALTGYRAYLFGLRLGVDPEAGDLGW